MPRVPFATRQIHPEMPGVVPHQVAPSPESYGAGLAETGMNVFGRLYAQRAEDERQQADSVALLNFDNNLAGWEHQNLYDPETGVLNTVKGQDAVGLTESVGQKFQEYSGDLISKLLPRQQEAAARRVSMRWQDMTRTLDSYGSREADAFEQGQVDSSIKNSISAAGMNATDPERVNTELQRQSLVIGGYAQKQGWSPELTQSKIQDAHTATHVSVIDNLLSQNKDVAAQTYFDAVKDQISGDKLASIQRAVEEGSLQGEAQRQSDQIMATTKTLGDAEDKVKSITDPKLRDKVQSYVEHGYQVQEVQERQAKEATMISLANQIDKGGLRSVATSSAWSGLTIPERTSLELYAKRNLKPADDEGPSQLTQWYQLKQQADAAPEKFAALNLLTYLGKVSKGQFKDLTDLQSAIRKGDNKQADTLNNDFRTVNEIVTDQLQTAGIIKTGEKPDEALVARVHNAVAEQGRAFTQEHGGKQPTKADYEKMSSDLISKAVLVPGGFWSGVFHPLSLPTDLTTRAAMKRLISLSIDDVPANDQQLITDELRQQGRAVTPDAILQVYIAHQAAQAKPKR